MFTGIIQNQGVVTRREKRGGQIRFAFRMVKKEKFPLKAGESVAVNGVCLTVAKFSGPTFEADVIADTLKVTTLSLLKVGERVNLERSLRKGDRFGGHFVTGHVDGAGVIKAIKRTQKNIQVTLAAPKSLLRFMAVKGSIAIDGVSLTIQSLAAELLNVSLIPFTYEHTTFSGKKAGDKMNLEVDLIARYLDVLKISQPVSLKALKLQGF